MSDLPPSGVSVLRSRGDKRALPDEVGRVGLPVYAGRVYDEPLAELQGLRGVQAYRQMGDDDYMCGAILYVTDQLIRRVQWSAEPASSDPQDQFYADFVLSCLHDMSATWDDTISFINSKIQYGWSLAAVAYKRRLGYQDPSSDLSSSAHADGLIGWRKFAPRLQETLSRWELDESGGVQGMHQTAAPTFQEVLIPIADALLFRTTAARGNPEGRSMLRSAYRPHFYKRRFEQIEGIGFERYLAGLPIGRAPADYLAADAPPDKKAVADALLDAVARIRKDEEGGIVLPSDRDESGNLLFDINLLNGGAGALPDTDKVITRLDQRIAMVLLADWLLLGHEAVGARSLGESKTELFALALDTFVQADADVLNRHGVPRLMRLNGWDPARSPKLSPGTVERVDFNELIESLAKLAGTGMPLFPDDELDAHLRSILQIPGGIDETL